MQLLRTLSGVLWFVLLTSNGLADIGLKLRNSAYPNYGRGKAYLPPPVQELPIDEEYSNDRRAPQHQQKFQETSYGDAKYQIFEVHSHYEQPSAAALVQPQPHTTTQEIRIQHVNLPPGGHDDSLDLSFLSFAAGVGGDGQQFTISEQIPRARPAPAPATAIPFPSSYRHNFGNQREGRNLESNAYLPPHQQQHLTSGGAAQYLPPHEATPHTPPVFRGPGYLPPHGEENRYHHQQPPQGQYSAPEHHQSNFQGNGYLPPHKGQHQADASHPNAIHDHQHQHQQGSGRPVFKGPDYLPPLKNHQHRTRNAAQYESHHQQAGQNSGFKGPDYLPPLKDQQAHNQQQAQSRETEPGLTTPDYHEHQHPHSRPAGNPTFKAPDYLPPFQGHHESHRSQPQPAYKAPDYLPPHQAHSDQLHHDHHATEVGSNDGFMGQDYLPPHNDYQQQEQHAPQTVENTPSQRPDYVSPFKDLHPHHQQQYQQQPQEQNQQQEAQYNQHHEAQHQHQHLQQQQQQQLHLQQHQTVDGPSFKAPDYLPPHTNSPQFPTAPPLFEAPDYLPPHQEHHQEEQEEVNVEQSRAPGHLPSGYDYGNPEGTQQQASQPQNYVQPEAPAQTTLVAPTSLPAGYEFEKPANAEEAIAELHSQQQEPQYQHQVDQQQGHQQQEQPQYQHQAPTQATIPHHQDQQIVQAQIQIGENEGQSEVVYGRHSQEADGAYLPPQRDQQSTVASPITTVQTQATYQTQHPVGDHHGPNAYEQTVSAPHHGSAQQNSQQHLAPVTSSIAPVQPVAALHSLSSFMNTVQPFERYGAAQFTSERRPFPAYGPPPQSSFQQPSYHAVAPVQQAAIEVAPMYREQASRPQHYAPQMSYATSAVHATSYASQTTFQPSQFVQQHQQQAQRHQEQYQTTHQQHQASQSHAQNSYALSTQARQSLQRLMPLLTTVTATAQAPTLPTTAAALPTAPLTSGKIRTVQIVNPTAVKTLKVLETSDKDGVKTIKILGHSNEDPMGEHRVVKVVSSNAYNGNGDHVQTVKIFNDHKEVTVSVAPEPITTVATAPATNGYLPPSKTHVKRRTATGRARHRY